jgi:HK97 family phage major capsid protein
MSATDNLLASMVGEIEDRQQFIDSLVQAAKDEQQDLSPDKLELITRATTRIGELNERMKPLEEARRISGESAERIAQLARFMSKEGEKPTEMKYRTAGEYVLDRWRAGLGQDEAVHRLDLYHRAAAHQTTGDNPGLLPEQILGPVINFIDAARPLVSAFGPRQLPAGSWSRPRVTQHTNVAEQTAEKTELVSRKMTIAKLPVAAKTYGGYVNVSRQDIDWSQPQIMDIIIGDLAAMYAQLTEDVFGDALVAAGTAADASTTLPTGANTAQQIAGVVWAAAGKVYSATKGAGRVILAVSPDMLGLVGPIFAPVNPQNAQSSGFSAGDLAQGPVGAISGITVVMSAQLATGTMLAISGAAAEVYEDRIGALQVVEPSVLGVQVAYAGYFAPLIIEATGIQKIVKTP